MESYLLPLLAVAIGLALLVFRLASKSSSKPSSASAASSRASPDNKVQLDPAGEARYLANQLRPTSTPLDILYAAATSPDMLAITQKHLDLREDVVFKKLEALKKDPNESNVTSMEDLLSDDSGWAEEEDDAATAAAKKAALQKEKEAKQLAAATGKEDVTKLKLEGIDDGVLGAEWVKKQCETLKCWPPPHFQGDLSNPAVERNLLMTMGRLHAKQLNTHPELMKAGPEGNIDRTYFNSTLEFRGRIGQLLEAALKMACTLKCYRLSNSILDAMIMFKIGLMDCTDEKELHWFKDMMLRQYGEGNTPKLIFGEQYLGVPKPPVSSESEIDNEKEAKKNEIAAMIAQSKQVTTTDDKMSLEIHVTRQHAESFTKEKLAMCQKQGIPPQIGMQTYKESWFIMVRAKKIGGTLSESDVNCGNDFLAQMKESGHKLYEMLNGETAQAFHEEFEEKNSRDERRLVVAWPFEVKNVAQKAGRVTMNLMPPEEEGRYEFSVIFKSMDFLGVDEEFVLELDVKKGVEKEIVKEEEEDEEEEEEVGDKKNN
ncbi:hypothetical protein ACHAXN_009900 [Cyclotella atomus]